MSSDLENLRPKVGVGVIVTSPAHPGCVVLGKRKGSSGSGTYALPGGHLEFGEDWYTCAARETLEETGLVIKNMRFASVVNAVMWEKDYHYITLFIQAEVDMTHPLTEPATMEPDKCEGWFWYEWTSEKLEDQMFLPLQSFRNQKYDPFNREKHGHKHSDLFTVVKKKPLSEISNTALTHA